MSHKVTIKELAIILKLSPATVSRALNDSYEIGEGTKEKVRALAKELNYQPDRIASSLRSKRTKLIGVLLPDISYFFNSTALKGIEEVLIPKGYRVIIFQTGESYNREVENLKDLASFKVDGIIASLSAETRNLSHFHENLPSDTPLVFIDRVPSENDYIKIGINNKKAAYNAVKYLIKKGKKKIAWLAGPEGLKISEFRYEGYCQAHLESGLSIDPSLKVECEFSGYSAFNAIVNLIKNKADTDAIFSINDRLAIEVLAAVQVCNKRIPQDIQVLGFNNESFSPFLKPSLSTILQPAYEMGIEAANQLLKLISGKRPEIKEYIFDTKLIEREST
jgi:DNA-binding LacI/PurR family transcriptional regulator